MFKCKQCEKEYVTSQGLAGHISAMIRYGYHTKIEYISTNNIRLNSLVILENEKYECPYCKKQYVKKGIATHIWKNHTESGQTSNCNFGYKVNSKTTWNKGLTKDTDKRVNSSKNVPWNKGLTKDTDKRVKQSGITLSTKIKNGIIIPYNIGTHRSDETKKKISEKLSLNNHGGKCKWFDYIRTDGLLIKLQGTWEVRFANVLNHIDESWIKIKVGNSENSFKWIDDNDKEHTYSPDFYSPKLNKYFEVKGFWWGNDKRKMEIVMDTYKNINIEIINKEKLEMLESLYK